ncbi:MAG TPA: SPFH domain-containing protein [Anaerolineae bacterium]|nr:SPFH domain-containing protein [Anaerolineae bacterium]HMR64850.1 SPFH domain-containing protein [Anaerolineae bacterium]
MTVQTRGFSKVKEAVATWSNIRQLLRSGEGEHLVPVVIPKDRRGYGFLFWFALAAWMGLAGLLSFSLGGIALGVAAAIALIVLGAASWWFSAKVEIEEGTTGIYSRFGKIEGILSPGRNFLWWPWDKVEYIVDTSTEIPYTAPVMASPTQENVPLKSIEFFLKFKITDPVKFVRIIGATNFDSVLSSAVQDAIRRRSRFIETAKAYDLRGSNVEDMQQDLNKQMERYGVRIIGANIPDVQLPDQYRENLATRERVAKELVAYEKEWELIRKRKNDEVLMQIERAKKERDEKVIAVKEALNRARQEVAQMLQEKETEAEKVRLEIEARGRAELKAAENEARALESLGQSYQDNQAVLKYQLELQGLQVAKKLMENAPRPLIVNSQAESSSSPLSTLLLAQILPEMMQREKNGHQFQMPTWVQRNDEAGT